MDTGNHCCDDDSKSYEYGDYCLTRCGGLSFLAHEDDSTNDSDNCPEGSQKKKNRDQND